MFPSLRHQSPNRFSRRLQNLAHNRNDIRSRFLPNQANKRRLIPIIFLSSCEISCVEKTFSLRFSFAPRSKMIYRKAICFVFSFLLASQLFLRFRASFVATLKVEMEKAGRKLSQTHFAAICLLAENGAVHGEGSKSFARHIAYSLKSLDL